MAGKGVEPNKFVKGGDAVADDRNWIARIQNEMNCTHSWQKDWGFLAGGSDHLNVENATKPYSVDEQIQKIEQQLQEIQPNKKLETTARQYGLGNDLERFKDKNYNIHKNKDLRPLERKLDPKWKKGKPNYTEDPYDPLKNLFKKKK